MNETTLVITIFIFVLVVATIVLRKRLGITDWFATGPGGFKWQFKANETKGLTVSLGNYLGLVVSTDGETRKWHLDMVLVANNSKVIDNFELVMDKETTFRIKQFYTENQQLLMRFPDRSIKLPLKIDAETISLSAEFETRDYHPFDFPEGIHNFTLLLTTNQKRYRKKFKTELSKSNVRALQLAREHHREHGKVIATSDQGGQVSIIRVPILL